MKPPFPRLSHPAHPTGSTYLGILFHQLGKIVEKAVLRTEKIKLIVALLFLHELCQKLAPIPGHKLSCEFYHIQVKGGDGGRVCDELKLRRGLFGHNGLLNHLGLHLRCRENVRKAAQG